MCVTNPLLLTVNVFPLAKLMFASENVPSPAVVVFCPASKTLAPLKSCRVAAARTLPFTVRPPVSPRRSTTKGPEAAWQYRLHCHLDDCVRKIARPQICARTPDYMARCARADGYRHPVARQVPGLERIGNTAVCGDRNRHNHRRARAAQVIPHVHQVRARAL